MKGNRREINKEGPDYYPTPAWATRGLLYFEKFNGYILEPCCGEGHIVKELVKNNYHVFGSDLYQYGDNDILDVFDINTEVDNIITNPPYNIASDVFYHLYPLIINKICFLVRMSFLESKKRYNLFQSFSPSKILIFTERLSMSPAGIKIEGGGTVSYCWIIWDKKNKNPTIIQWIPPGFKNNGLD